MPATSRASSIAAHHPHIDSSYAPGHHHHHHDSQQSALANAAKKGKQKKATDPNEASKLIAAKISQLELDAAGEKDQEAEIGWSRPFQIRPHSLEEPGSHAPYTLPGVRYRLLKVVCPDS